MFIGSCGLVLMGIGIGELGVSQITNSIWSNFTTLIGHPMTPQLVDTSVSSVYISWGFIIVVLSLLAYIVPKIMGRRRF